MRRVVSVKTMGAITRCRRLWQNLWMRNLRCASKVCVDPLPARVLAFQSAVAGVTRRIAAQDSINEIVVCLCGVNWSSGFPVKTSAWERGMSTDIGLLDCVLLLAKKRIGDL